MDFFLSTDFQAQVELMIKQHHVPGIAVAIVQDGKISSAGYGQACLDPSEPCTPDTLFDIASCSKSFTAASIGLLVEDEKHPEVQYSAMMSSLLPDDFVMPKSEYTDGVTLDDVLGHTTGMGRHDLSYRSPRAEEPDTPQSVTRNLRNLTVVALLRSKHIYNNMMYTVLTHLLEVKTQHPFSELLQKQFFQPLGMTSSALQPASACDRGMGDRLATGYAWVKSSKSFHGFDMADCPEAQGAGSIITSANDFILWVKALIHREGTITEKLYQGLIRLRSIPDPSLGRLKRYRSPTFYAAGIGVCFHRGHMVIGHDGGVPGFGSRFFFLPDLKFGAVVMGNSSESHQVVSTLANKLIDSAIGVPEEGIKRNKEKHKAGKRRKEDETANPTEVTLATRELPQRKKHEHAAQPAKKNQEQTKDNNVKPPSKAKGRMKDPPKPPEPQQTPLHVYAGDYRNPGYHTFTVEIKNGKLFIDAPDRSMPFTLTFEHLSDQTEYTAHLSDMFEGEDETLDARFVFEGERAIKLGLQLEWGSKEIIWFERM